MLWALFGNCALNVVYHMHFQEIVFVWTASGAQFEDFRCVSLVEERTQVRW